MSVYDIYRTKLGYSVLMWMIIIAQMINALFSQNWFAWLGLGFLIGIWLWGMLNIKFKEQMK